MRLSTLILFIPLILSAQRGRPVTLPIYGAAPQVAGSIDVPISAATRETLENFRLAVKGADGTPLYADRATLVKAWLSDAGVIEQLVIGVTPSAGMKVAAPVETITVSLTADQETLLEVKRLNVHGDGSTLTPGTTTFSPVFSVREDLFRAAVISPGGIFWGLLVNPKFTPANLKALLAGSPPTSDIVQSAIKSALQ